LDQFIIEGERPLSGSVRVQGAKNAALPILAASIMAEGTLEIEDVPKLLDIQVMLDILEALGCEAIHDSQNVILNTSPMKSFHIPEDLMGQMRSSIFLMGPLLVRFGKAQIYRPGGCAIGERPIDLHLKGLQKLGAHIEESHSLITCTANRLIGTDMMLDIPSVGATENIMMAATFAEGTTKIRNAAREPEIVDLQNFINAMGGKVRGAGTGTITVEGVQKLNPIRYRVIPDRIVAGTLMVAAAMTGGEVQLKNVQEEHVSSVIHVLRESGVEITLTDDIMNVKSIGRPKAVEKITTSYYPSFPTDMQSPIMSLLAVAEGTSMIKETVFSGRFKHVSELVRMGAKINVDLNSAIVHGVSKLYGTSVKATDLRAGAALVIAGLAAEGTTRVDHIHYIDRGYEHLEETFQQLGAHIKRISRS
jgi:UDP-N-acetylglucosamine 1-carboxyvinyltransferase